MSLEILALARLKSSFSILISSPPALFIIARKKENKTKFQIIQKCKFLSQKIKTFAINHFQLSAVFHIEMTLQPG